MFSKRSLAILGIYLSVFTNALMFTVVFPIASRMIMYFGLVKNRTETGYWVGFLAGSMMLGRSLSASIWGTLCDKWGRKTVLLIGIVTTSTLAIFFGMSTSFIWALSFRFLQGFFSPITIVTRTLLSEIYSVNEQASAMSCFILVGSFGNISGNIMGGFFVEPKDTNIEILDDYPFLLPNLIVSLSGIASLILCALFLEETFKGDSLIEQERPRGFFGIITDLRVRQVLWMYMLCSFIGTGIGEVLVLWAWAKIENGGFEFTTADIGLFSALTSSIFVLYIRTLYKKVTAHYGLIKTCQNALFISIPVILAWPLITFLRYSFYAKFSAMVFASLLYNSIDFMSITTVLIFINNSVGACERGKVNGYSMAFGNFARGLSPPLFGVIFATTAKSDWPFPFNFSFSFILLSLIVALAWRSSKTLALSLEKPKEPEKVEVTQNIESEMMSIAVIEETELD